MNLATNYVKLAIDKLCFRVLFIKRYHHHTEHNMSLHVHKYFELFLSNMTISVKLIFQNTLHSVMITVEYMN